MGMFDLTIDTSEANKALDFLKNVAPAAAQAILGVVGYDTMDRQIELTPKELGSLRASTRRDQAMEEESNEFVIVVDEDYAAAVNCMEGANFQEPGTQAHFAEAALQEVASGELPRRLAAELLERMGLPPL